MTTYYLPDGENWWEIYEEAEKQYRNAQEQRGNISRSALGPRRISSYSTQSTRSPRLRPNALPADRYYLNYKLYYESRRFDERPEGITVNTTDPTMDHDLYGVDPIMELIKVKPQGSSNGPTRARIDGFSLKINRIHSYLPQNLAANKSLALDGEDVFEPGDLFNSMDYHSFSRGNDRGNPEQRNYGAVKSNNKFQQFIQVFNPQRPGIELMSNVNDALTNLPQLQVETNRSNRGEVSPGYETSTLLENPSWSKMMTAIIRQYTYEYHDFLYSTPWANDINTFNYIENQTNITREPKAMLNPEYNFFDPEHNASIANLPERRIAPIHPSLEGRNTGKYWLGHKTETLVAQETLDLKGQFPYYIELQMPTQKEGPLLKAMRKFGFEEAMLEEISKQFESQQQRTRAFEQTPVFQKTSWMHPVRSGVTPRQNRLVRRRFRTNTSNSDTFLQNLDNPKDDKTRTQLDSIEFYGSKNSFFQKFYDDVLSGRTEVCRSYRDRMMLMGIRSKIENILGKRENRITYIQTLPQVRADDQNQPHADNLKYGPCKTETLFYKITKRRDGDIVSSFIISNPKKQVLNFIDTQVKMNTTYTYEVDAFVASYGIAYRYVLPGFSNRNWWVRHQRGGTNDEGERFGSYYSPGTHWGSRTATEEPSGRTTKQNPLICAFVHYIPSVKIFKVPVFHNINNPRSYLPSPSAVGICLPQARIIDRPPAPPGVTFIPYRGNTKKILINLSDNIESIGVGSTGVRYLAFNNSEAASFEEIHQNQKLFENPKLQPGHIEFRSEGDSQSIEVYRTTEKPIRGATESFEDRIKKPYDVFNIGEDDTEPHKTINLNKQTAFKDDIEPNVTYYYAFRTRDRNGYISNPSAIYSVEIVDEDGKVYALTNVYEPVRPKKLTVQKQKLVRYLEISPSLISSEIFSHPDHATGDQIGLVSGQDSVFEKTFKVRIRSTDTGRVVDLNIRFRDTVELNQNIQREEEVEQEDPLCEDNEEE
jgi:hypothetical protein